VILLIPAFAPLLAAALITLLAILRPRFSYHWLLGVAGALASWVAVWLIRFRLPLVFGLLEGEFAGLSLPALSLSVDYYNWSIALAVSTLCLAVLFTDVGRAAQVNWSVWAGDLGVAALGMVAVLASNLSTLLLAWTALDFIELAILLRRVREERIRRRVLVFFATNILGTMMIFGAMIAANASGMELSFTTIPPQAQLYLILGVGMRMGVFPLQIAFLRDPRSQRGEATLLRLIPVAAGLSILVHTARIQSSVGLRGVLLAFSALAALYGAIVWARINSELRGRVFWIIGMAGLVFAASVQSQPEAVLSWGLALIYLGALLFLASSRPKYYLPMGILGALSLTGLPFTPTFAGMQMYSPFHFLLFLFPAAQALLLVGYVRHMLRETEPITGVERWVQVIYPTGLALLPLMYLLSIYLNPNVPVVGRAAYLPLGGVLLILIALGIGYWRQITIPENVFTSLDRVFSLHWVYALVEWLGNLIGKLLSLISILIEGEGGVLWTLVFLLMLVSILSQVVGGAGV
jgi:hypothetical protein